VNREKRARRAKAKKKANNIARNNTMSFRNKKIKDMKEEREKKRHTELIRQQALKAKGVRV
jgi:hypothetical protein